MAELILVRHGQAMAFDADHDRLSETGHEQARRLGAFWAGAKFHVDAVVSGGLRRHRETEAAVRAAYESAGLPFPKLEVDPGWNEYEAHDVVGELGPRLAQRDANFAGLFERAQSASGPDRNRHFQRAFEALTEAWAHGDVHAPGVQAFAEFHHQVSLARARLLASRTGTVVVFTSGGPIGVNVQLTLDAPAAQALRVNSRVKNTSLTHFIFSGRRPVTMDAFNLLPHLDDELVTFR